MKKLFPLLCFHCHTLLSLPMGGEIIFGEVNSAIVDQSIEIVASDGAILEWRDFSISEEETARFIQPSTEALVLNRVTGGSVSHILGRLEANGRVVLLNPAGVLIGSKAQINIGSLIASTLDLQNLKNQQIFEGRSDGKIIVSGNVIAQNDLFLIAEQIEISGKIQSKREIGLISGTKVELSSEGLAGLSYEHPGVIDRENFFAVPNISVSGSIVANGIALFGPAITLMNGAVIDASGQLGGFPIWIGGSQKGSSPTIQNAEALFVHSGTKIYSNAIENGNGGNVILWSDHCTIVEGPIYAQGGPLGGDGGFIEISSHGTLLPNGMVYTNAPLGKQGLLLIDPVDVTLGDPPLVNFGFMAPPPYNPITFTANNAVITYNTLQVWLNGGNNVTIQTNQALGGTGNITTVPIVGFILPPPFNEYVGWNTAANLVFDIRGTTGSILLQHSFACHGTGSISILADGPPRCGGPPINTITIRGSPATQNERHMFFGSAFGNTIINAPGYDLILETNNVVALMLPMAMVGYPSGTVMGSPISNTATGPISVTCNNLIMRDTSPVGQAANFAYATQIGHGWASNAGAATIMPMTTTATATIDVTVYGDITMNTGRTLSFAHIGHGGNSPVNTSSLDGRLTVNCGGDLIMNVGPTSIGGKALIGHGSFNTPLAGGAPALTINGDLNLTVGGSISMFAVGPSGVTRDQQVVIGHSGPLSGASVVSIGTLRPAPVTVRCAGNLLMQGTTLTRDQLIIGNAGPPTPTPVAINGGVFLSVGGNLTMQSISTNPSSAYFIGRANGVTLTGFSPVEVAIGGSLSMNGLGTLPTQGFQIGISDPGAAAFTSTSVMVGGSIALTSALPSPFGLGITSFGNVNVAAGGNIDLTGIASAAAGRVFIGTNDTDNVLTPRTTRIFSAGSIVAQNSNVNNFASFGRAYTNPVTPTFSTDLRASGDVQLASSIITTIGTISISSDAALPTGILWQNSAGNLVSCCAQPIMPLAYSVGAFIPVACITTAPNGALLATSINVPINGIGGVIISPSPLPTQVAVQTTTGNIAILSAPLATNGSTQNLTIGTNALSDLNIITTSGNIEIFGSTEDLTNCVRPNSFANITIDIPITTTGSVFMSAQNSITITSTGSISTPSSVTLIVDNQSPVPPFIGSGFLQMDPGSFINGNTVSIYTALQGSNLNQGLINGALFQPGTLFEDTAQEVWCAYFCSPLPSVPFTISYKNCQQQLTQQAMVIIDEILVNLHPYNEYPGWKERFRVIWLPSLLGFPFLQHYYIGKRHLNLLNHPKTFTVYTDSN